MTEPTYDQAYRILFQFRRDVVRRLAAEVMQQEEALENPMTGKGEEIVDRFGSILCHTDLCLLSLGPPKSMDATRPEKLETKWVEPQDLVAVMCAGPIRAETIGCPLDDVGKRISEWFQVHPSVRPLAIQVVPAPQFSPVGTECTVLLVYVPPSSR